MGARIRTRSLSHSAEVEERSVSPLPALRSFARPVARGLSIARDPSWNDTPLYGDDTGEGGGSDGDEGGDDECRKCRGDRRRRRREGEGEGAGRMTAAARLVGVLGKRVALVQLEGLGALATTTGGELFLGVFVG